VCMDLKAKLYGKTNAPAVIDVIAGLGGREVNEATIQDIVEKAKESLHSDYSLKEPYWAGLNEAIVP